MTPALINSICHKICEFGMSDSAAAAHCGIPASTVSRWKFLHPDLELRFLSAREDFRIRHIYEIQHAATKDGRRDWRAAAWLLERVFPEDYARRPGRRVNPASENHTWLDEARAENTASQHSFYKHEVEKAFQWRGDQARDYMSDPDWDRKEGNVGCLPGEEYLVPTAEPDPDVLPQSYAAYAEATEEALREAKAARAHEAAPAAPTAPISKITETLETPETSLPLRHPHPAEPAPSATREPASISAGAPLFAPACSKTRGGAEAPPSPDLRRGQVAGGAEPAVAAQEIAEIPLIPAPTPPLINLTHNAAATESATPPPISKITETPAPQIPVTPVLPEFPLPLSPKTTAPNPFQNYRNPTALSAPISTLLL